MKITPLDLLVIGFVIFGAYRLYMARKGGGGGSRDDDRDQNGSPVRRIRTKPSDLRPPARSQQTPPPPPRSATDSDRNADDDQPTPRQASEAYQRARQQWEGLLSEPRQTPSGGGSVAPGADTPDNFDQDDFLDGAKAMYARISESWQARDMDDLAQFTTDHAMKAFTRRAQAETRPSAADILLVNAQLLEMKTDNNQERATVFYDAMLKSQSLGGTIQTQEIWIFQREKGQDTMWLLDESRPVDGDTPIGPQ